MTPGWPVCARRDAEDGGVTPPAESGERDLGQDSVVPDAPTGCAGVTGRSGRLGG